MRLVFYFFENFKMVNIFSKIVFKSKMAISDGFFNSTVRNWQVHVFKNYIIEYFFHFSVRTEDFQENFTRVGVFNRILDAAVEERKKYWRPETITAYKTRCNLFIVKKRKTLYYKWIITHVGIMLLCIEISRKCFRNFKLRGQKYFFENSLSILPDLLATILLLTIGIIIFLWMHFINFKLISSLNFF